MLKPNGHIQAIDIRFSYDINGLLEDDVLLEETAVNPESSVTMPPH